MQKMMQHPSHPEHWLTFVRYPHGFVCNGCGEGVHGCGYRCAHCNFNLHECCAKPPPALHQSFHGGNGNWIQFQTRPPGGSQMQCSECAGSVSGFGYYWTSSSCGYALHPTCALLPCTTHTPLETATPPKRHAYVETPPKRHAYVETAPKRHAYVETAPTRHDAVQSVPPQPDLKSQDKDGHHHTLNRMAVKGGKFLLNLGVGAISGDPTSIGGALVDLLSPN